MTDTDVALLEEEQDDFEEEETVSPEVLEAAKQHIAERCKAVGILFEEYRDEIDEELHWKLELKCGRDSRAIVIWHAEDLLRVVEAPFEEYSFLSGLEALCSYSGGIIEAGIKSIGAGFVSSNATFRRIFGRSAHMDLASDEYKLVLEAPGDSDIKIELSPCSQSYLALVSRSRPTNLTIKISGLNIRQHDKALEVLEKYAGSLFFQLDLSIGIAYGLARQHKRVPSGSRTRVLGPPAKELLQFPTTEFDNAPLSLYWYGRSAEAMPLLQFLAFYQVIEFYFPIYSQSEAQRKLKTILKDPTFRGDRDADVARLLSAIHVSRSGAYGDERSQLKATIIECVDSDSIRNFISNDITLKDFYLAGSKSLPYHKIPVANAALDLRADIAERIYDIRCKIVHTKSDSRDLGGELLLPFSKEAELLGRDIKLIQYVAQSVLIAGSRTYHV